MANKQYRMVTTEEPQPDRELEYAKAYRVGFTHPNTTHASTCCIIAMSVADAFEKCRERIPGAQPFTATATRDI